MGDLLSQKIEAEILRGGRKENHLLIASELDFYLEQKNKFDVLHNRMFREQYRNIQEKAGATFQKHAITLDQEGMTALQAIDQVVSTKDPMQFSVTRTYVKDIIAMTSILNKRCSIER
jgi:hypothetical protein